jgi:hypothetical protein
VDDDIQPPKQGRERVVLPLGPLEVHGVEEPVRRVVERPPERAPRALDEDVEQRRGHRPGAVRGERDGRVRLAGHGWQG